MSEARRLVGRLLGRTELGLIVSILVVIVLTSIFDTNHIYWNSPGPAARDVTRQTVMLGIFALGSAIVIIAGGIDLSSGSVIAFSGTICAMIMLVLAPEGMSKGEVPFSVMGLAIGGALLTGFLIGSLHAWLITVVGLPPFVATLATLVGLRSLGRAMVENVTQQVLGARSTQIQIFDERFRTLTTNNWIPVVIFIVLAIACWILLSKTVVGRHIYALGGNEQAARLSGIRTDRLKWLAYTISAMLASVAGVLYICEQSVADPQSLGRGYELNAIAAAVVGGCSLQGGVGTISGTVLGCVFLRVVIDGVAKIIKGGSDVYEGIIVGSVVVIAVALNQIWQSGKQGKQFFPGALGWVAAATLALLGGVIAFLLFGVLAGQIVAVAAIVLLTLTKVLEQRRAAALLRSDAPSK